MQKVRQHLNGPCSQQHLLKDNQPKNHNMMTYQICWSDECEQFYLISIYQKNRIHTLPSINLIPISESALLQQQIIQSQPNTQPLPTHQISYILDTNVTFNPNNVNAQMINANVYVSFLQEAFTYLHQQHKQDVKMNEIWRKQTHQSDKEILNLKNQITVRVALIILPFFVNYFLVSCCFVFCNLCFNRE